MNITADTNVLVRIITEDDPEQSIAAQAVLASSNLVALPIVSICELAWVLGGSYSTSKAGIAAAIRRLIDSENVVSDIKAVEAGLAFLDAGGDFADGVVIHQGMRLERQEFISFDKKAVALAKAQGRGARLLA